MQTQEIAQHKPYTAPNKQIYAWGFGALASHFLIQTFGQAGNILTIGFGVSPVIIGWATMLPRLIDGVTDPYIGHLSDDTHTRWGRRKPYLVAAAILGAFFMCAIWWANPKWSQTQQLVYLSVVGTLCYICYGIYTMAWTAIGYELTDDYHERSRVMMWGSVGLAVVALSSAWFFRAALLPIFGTAMIGMRWISLGVAVFVIASALTAAKVCKERFTQSNREHVPLLPAMKVALTNRPFVILLLYKLSDVLGGRLGGAMIGYLSLYMLCAGNKVVLTTVTGLGATIGTVCTFAILPFMKVLSVKMGKRSAQILGAAVSLANNVLWPFVLLSGKPYLVLVPILVFTPLQSIAFTLGNAIVPDICDTDELQTGQRREGLFSAVMAFMAKMEISLCNLVVGYLIAFSGLNVKIVHQAPHVMHKLFWMAIPIAIFFSALGLVFTVLFPLTEAKMRVVREQLDQRRQAVQSTERPADQPAALPELEAEAVLA